MRKKAAMEMSVGTIVTIVLLVSVLIMGIFMVQKIFGSGIGAVDSIDKELTNQINELFAADTDKEIVIFPPSRRISLEKGEKNKGFAFSIRNLGTESATISFEVEPIETSCDSLSLDSANDLIALGKTGQVQIGPGNIMKDPKLVTFIIPETTPPCLISYSITLEKNGQIYGSSSEVIVEIKSN